MIRVGDSNVMATESVLMGAKVRAAVVRDYARRHDCTLLFGSVARARKEASERGAFGFWRRKS